MFRILAGCFLLWISSGDARAHRDPDDPLQYKFSGGYGQVEVGGRYAGVEFHNSRPLPSRISFYYPVANSIDLSTDYWKRGDSRPMAAGIRVDGGPAHWIGREPWEYVLSPHRVMFVHAEDSLMYSLRYEFGFREPLMMCRLTIQNAGSRPRQIEAYLHLKPALRTCQTYTRYDSAWTWYDKVSMAAFARFSESQTAGACVVVQNAGEHPSGSLLDAARLSVTDSGTSAWVRSPVGHWPAVPAGERRRPALAAFPYAKLLDAGDSLVIVLLIGSCKGDEAGALVNRWKSSWREDINAYDRFVGERTALGAKIQTGDPWVDRSILWSSALLATNAHFLENAIVPMPCPAEYNFFFTHDMLLTDLAAVCFDPTRVRRDLAYLADHARDSVIPHAYYWRDDGFKTEYCPPDDWNHLWFILATGTYLRHSMDSGFGKELFPLVAKSMREALLRLRGDHLMYAAAPDWWDIGKNEGPRAYMTVLIIRALREYLFIASFVGESSPGLKSYEQMADAAEKALGERLWDGQTHYLTNFNGSRIDPHYYMGSLLAPVFHVLDADRSRQLVETAGRKLVAPGVGVRTAMPPDFHTDSMRAFFQFAGNEAGDPYLYANGGVWPHNNAWYTLALRAAGRADDAFKFFRQTMTLDGIAQSPMGQPAMYEYRYSDNASPEYGRIDKPSFLWAAGFTLYTAYRLVGIDENEWNVCFSRPLPSSLDTVSCSVEFSGKKQVVRTGGEKGGVLFTADDVPVPSLVVPLALGSSSLWRLQSGASSSPRLETINAILRSADFPERTAELRLVISSFPGHAVSATISAKTQPRTVAVDGRPVEDMTVQPGEDGNVLIHLGFVASAPTETIVIRF